MTDTQEAMRDEFEKWWEKFDYAISSENSSGYVFHSTFTDGLTDREVAEFAWQAATAQSAEKIEDKERIIVRLHEIIDGYEIASKESAEKIARLEAYIKQLEAVSVTEEELSKACEDALFKAAAAELSNKQLREALTHVDAYLDDIPHGDNCFVSNHYEGDPGNRCNCGKDAVCQVVDASLAQQPSTEALEAYVAQRTKELQASRANQQGDRSMITPKQAVLICEAHDIFQTLESEEEVALLEDNNPELLEAYFALHRYTVGATDPDGNLVPDSDGKSEQPQTKRKPCTCDGRCDGFCMEQGKE